MFDDAENIGLIVNYREACHLLGRLAVPAIISESQSCQTACQITSDCRAPGP